MMKPTQNIFEKVANSGNAQVIYYILGQCIQSEGVKLEFNINACRYYFGPHTLNLGLEGCSSFMILWCYVLSL